MIENPEISTEKAIDIIKTIFGITLIFTKYEKEKIMLLDENAEHKNLIDLIKI